MKNKYAIPVPAIIAIGFTVPIVLTLAFSYFLYLFDIPTPEQSCKKYCATKNQSGQLVSIFTRTQSSKGGGSTKCQCNP